MVGKTGFEPATPWSQTKCSTKLSHFPKYGALEGIRTPDLLVRSQTLYPAELRAHCHVIYLKWWLQRELNQRHKDFQSSALPTELWSQKKWRFRRESNSRSSAWQADVITATPRNHLVAGDGFEPTTSGLWAQRATKLLHPAILLNNIKWRRKRDSNPRAVADLPVFKTGPFNQTWVFLQNVLTREIITHHDTVVNKFYEKNSLKLHFYHILIKIQKKNLKRSSFFLIGA